MAASRMCQGVSKSGSPMPSEMTSFIDWTILKKSRIPERGMVPTWDAICFFKIIGKGKAEKVGSNGAVPEGTEELGELGELGRLGKKPSARNCEVEKESYARSRQ